MNYITVRLRIFPRRDPFHPQDRRLEPGGPGVPVEDPLDIQITDRAVPAAQFNDELGLRRRPNDGVLFPLDDKGGKPVAAQTAPILLEPPAQFGTLLIDAVFIEG